MANIPLGHGEYVYVHDGSGSMSPAAISSAEGSNLANLLKNRQRFDFEWANAAARGAQTGMVQGSRGYQIDTKTEYLYDAGQWRLAIPYIEFSSTDQVIADDNTYGQTGWSVDTSRSTDQDMVTVSGNEFTFTQAGLYIVAVKCSGVSGSIFATTSFSALTQESPVEEYFAISGFTAGVSTLSTPYRAISDGTSLYLWYGNKAVTLSGRRVRILRMG